MNATDERWSGDCLSDQLAEFTCKARFFWSRRAGMKPHFIQPDKSTQSAFVESFDGTLRVDCLDVNWFASFEDARSAIENWWTHYNDVRPDSSFGRRRDKFQFPALAPDRIRSEGQFRQ